MRAQTPDILSTLYLLESLKGLTIQSAIQEQYFFNGKLDTESMGSLKLAFSNGLEVVFDCAGDAESLSIRQGGFSSKGTLEKDFDPPMYEWKTQPFMESDALYRMGFIEECYLETIHRGNYFYPSGCKLQFHSGDFLYIWTVESDNVFYAVNQLPRQHFKSRLNIHLQSVEGLIRSLTENEEKSDD